MEYSVISSEHENEDENDNLSEGSVEELEDQNDAFPIDHHGYDNPSQNNPNKVLKESEISLGHSSDYPNQDFQHQRESDDYDIKLLKIGKSRISDDDEPSEDEQNIEDSHFEFLNERDDENENENRSFDELDKESEELGKMNESEIPIHQDDFDESVNSIRQQIPTPSKIKKVEQIVVNNQVFENNVFQKPKRNSIDEDEKKHEAEVVVIVDEMEKVNIGEHKNKVPCVRKHIHSVFEPIFALKCQKLVGDELPPESTFSFISSRLKQSVFGMNEDQADQLMRIDETHDEFSNNDVLLCKPNTLVKKTWRMKNLGTKQWPKDTRIVSVTDGLYFEPPKLTSFLKPGEVMDLSIRIYIPESESGSNNIKEYIMRLY